MAREAQNICYLAPLPELISSVYLLNITYVPSAVWALRREPQAKPSPFLWVLIRAMKQEQDVGG